MKINMDAMEKDLLKKDIFYIGCHESYSGGFVKMAKDALSIGANTFQFFLRNPRGSKAKDVDSHDMEEFLKILAKESFGPILVHAPYTLNPASSKGEVRRFAKEVLFDDLMRMESFPGNFYNFHPGNHLHQGEEKGIDLVSEIINDILQEDFHTTLLLETMAGKGTELGKTFGELADMISKIHLSHKVGVCLDTCHIHDGGYDIVKDLDKVLEIFQKEIGLEKLYAIHLNDSKNELGAKKDRHALIGEGHLGLKTFERIINHEKLRHLPFFLETPTDLAGHKKEIELLKTLRHPSSIS